MCLNFCNLKCNMLKSLEKKYMPDNCLKLTHLPCTPKTSTQPTKKESQLSKSKLVRRKCAIIKMRQKGLTHLAGRYLVPQNSDRCSVQCYTIPAMSCTLMSRYPATLITSPGSSATAPKSHLTSSSHLVLQCGQVLQGQHCCLHFLFPCFY